jgi:hypothetical protein
MKILIANASVVVREQSMDRVFANVNLIRFGLMQPLSVYVKLIAYGILQQERVYVQMVKLLIL